MIIRKDKTYNKNSLHPNTDWIGDADWVLDDSNERDAEIEEKIISMYPNFDFVLNDDGTKIIDVIATEPVVTAEEIEAHKTERIQESKILLAKWLNDNPILYSDGKYYSVTEEKQSLLNGNLASYERAKSMGVVYDLKWNATEQPCESWSYTDLLTLSLNIAAYVAPKVSKQQYLEVQIRNCETVEDIDAVVIDYNE